MNGANLQPRPGEGPGPGPWFSCSGVATMSSKSSFRLNIFNIYHTTGLIRNATPGYRGLPRARYSTSSSSSSSSSSTSPVVLPVVPVQCRGSALYRSGNLLIITPSQDSVLFSVQGIRFPLRKCFNSGTFSLRSSHLLRTSVIFSQLQTGSIHRDK